MKPRINFKLIAEEMENKNNLTISCSYIHTREFINSKLFEKLTEIIGKDEDAIDEDDALPTNIYFKNVSNATVEKVKKFISIVKNKYPKYKLGYKFEPVKEKKIIKFEPTENLFQDLKELIKKMISVQNALIKVDPKDDFNLLNDLRNSIFSFVYNIVKKHYPEEYHQIMNDDKTRPVITKLFNNLGSKLGFKLKMR